MGNEYLIDFKKLQQESEKIINENTNEKYDIYHSTITDYNDIKFLLYYKAKAFRTGLIKYDQDDWIFVNYKTNKIYSQETIRKHFNYYIEKAKLPHLKIKNFRTSHATFLLSNGKNMEEVKDRLRQPT